MTVSISACTPGFIPSVLSIKMATLSKAKNISFNICKSYGKNANKYLGITNKEEPIDQNTEKKEAEQ